MTMTTACTYRTDFQGKGEGEWGYALAATATAMACPLHSVQLNMSYTSKLVKVISSLELIHLYV